MFVMLQRLPPQSSYFYELYGIPNCVMKAYIRVLIPQAISMPISQSLVVGAVFTSTSFNLPSSQFLFKMKEWKMMMSTRSFHFELRKKN